jgi:hypothetical protein
MEWWWEIFFGEGKYFLPQIGEISRVMKKSWLVGAFMQRCREKERLLKRR